MKLTKTIMIILLLTPTLTVAEQTVNHEVSGYMLDDIELNITGVTPTVWSLVTSMAARGVPTPNITTENTYGSCTAQESGDLSCDVTHISLSGVTHHYTNLYAVPKVLHTHSRY